jgi:hypothetical protein
MLGAAVAALAGSSHSIRAWTKHLLKNLFQYSIGFTQREYRFGAQVSPLRREAKVLAALAGTDVPHPKLIAACPSEDVRASSLSAAQSYQEIIQEYVKS